MELKQAAGTSYWGSRNRGAQQALVVKTGRYIHTGVTSSKQALGEKLSAGEAKEIVCVGVPMLRKRGRDCLGAQKRQIEQ
jgi:hypothetical protein